MPCDACAVLVAWFWPQCLSTWLQVAITVQIHLILTLPMLLVAHRSTNRMFSVLLHLRCLALLTQHMQHAQPAALVASTAQHPAGAMVVAAAAGAATLAATLVAPRAATQAATHAATQVASTHTQHHASTGETAAADGCSALVRRVRLYGSRYGCLDHMHATCEHMLVVLCALLGAA
jgi:hypothetical protein